LDSTERRYRTAVSSDPGLERAALAR